MVVLALIALGIWIWHQNRSGTETPATVKMPDPVETRIEQSDPTQVPIAAPRQAPEPRVQAQVDTNRDVRLIADTRALKSERAGYPNIGEFFNGGTNSDAVDTVIPSGWVKFNLVDETGNPYLAGCEMTGHSGSCSTEDIPAGRDHITWPLSAGLCYLFYNR
jgi:hypothetical protein